MRDIRKVIKPLENEEFFFTRTTENIIDQKLELINGSWFTINKICAHTTRMFCCH